MATNTDEYEAIFQFLRCSLYPAGFSKNEKRALRRKAKENYRVERNILFYCPRGGHGTGWKKVPRFLKERERIIEVCHALPEGGHFGRDRTQQKVAERYYWKSMWSDVKEYVRTCSVCQTTNDAKFIKEAAPLHPIPVKPNVWRQVGIDLIGPLPKTKHGNRYIVTLVDYFSKWPEAAPLQDKKAEGVAQFIYRMVCRFGCTKILISDQGREFVNKLNKCLFERFGTEHRISTAYHPQTNGLVERYNQTLQRSLVKLVNKQQNDWDDYLDGLLFAYRTSVQKSTKVTPFEMMYGRKPVLPIEKECLPSDSEDDIADLEEHDVDRYCQDMCNLQKKLFSKADSNIKKAQDRYKKDYDRKHHRKKELEPGVLVLLRNTARDGRKGDKLVKRWLGPYRITKHIEKGVYCLENPSTGRDLKKTVNSCRLKIFHKRFSPKPLLLNDSDVFQFGSPSKSALSTVFTSKSQQDTIPDDNVSSCCDDSIPPLPPPMPSLSQIKKGALITSRLQKRIIVSDSFLDGVSLQISVFDNTCIADPIPSLSVIPDLVGNSFTADPFRSSTVIDHADNNQSVKEGFATSSLQDIFHAEFLQDSAIDISLIPSDSQHAAVGCTRTHGGAFGPVPRCSSPLQEPKSDIKPQNITTAPKQRKKRIIDLTKDKKKYKPIAYWLKDLELYEEEEKTLVEGRWVSDNLISAVQRLLKTSNPLIGGLQPTILAETLNFEIQRGEFVQILNVYGSHWLTVSNLFCPPGVINIYDSMPNCALYSLTKRHIASMLMTKEESIEVQFVDVQIQSGFNDCGLFALAFATSLCAGANPAELNYIQHDFRTHLFKCLENRKITPFPTRQRKRTGTIRGHESIKVYCTCRQPEHGRMISCDSCLAWFHKDCVKAPKAAWTKKNYIWHCELCAPKP